MRIWIEEGPECQYIDALQGFLRDYGFSDIKFLLFQWRIKNPSMNQLSKWMGSNFSGKNLVITTRSILGKRLLGLNFNYHGYASGLNGNLAIVSLSNVDVSNVPVICLHEILHLMGLPHCSTKGCFMAFKLCNSNLRYCLECSHPCTEIKLCEKCRGDLYEKREN